MTPLGLAKRSVRGLVRGALTIAPVRRVVEGELARAARTTARPAAKPLPTFTDGNGVEHHLDPTLRDRLKPNWRLMCDPTTAGATPTDAALRDRLRKASKTVAEVERVLEVAAGIPVAGRILEFGCYDGSTAYVLSERAGTDVVASDLARYYLVQRPGQPETAAIAAEERALARLRERVRVLAGRPEGSVSFVEDDITASALEPGSFDLILSFEVLEHVQSPTDAFAAMAHLLKPGGVVYHDYNPFFSSIGGHSLVTLDLPWGHARLGADDVDRYLHEIRPSEADQALRFYRESLNRMTMAELRSAVGAAGLELVTLIPWYQRSLLNELTGRALAEVRASYPEATTDDLLATFVVVVARRPANGRQ
jgi:SAM-dependent methyltransferase